MLFDIDHFKDVNDTFGHHIGDDVLRHLVAAWRHRLRRSDVLVRTGGDEFVVLLGDADPDSAESVARDLVTLARRGDPDGDRGRLVGERRDGAVPAGRRRGSLAPSSRSRPSTSQSAPAAAACRRPGVRAGIVKRLEAAQPARRSGPPPPRPAALWSRARLDWAVRRPRSAWSSTALRSRTLAGVTSTHSSSRMNSSACSSESSRGGIRPDQLLGGGGAHVGDLALLGRVDVHVLRAGVLPDDHALVDLDARARRTARRGPCRFNRA